MSSLIFARGLLVTLGGRAVSKCTTRNGYITFQIAEFSSPVNKTDESLATFRPGMFKAASDSLNWSPHMDRLLVKLATGDDNHKLTFQSKKHRQVTWEQVAQQMHTDLGEVKFSVKSCVSRWRYLKLAAEESEAVDNKRQSWSTVEIEGLKRLFGRDSVEADSGISKSRALELPVFARPVVWNPELDNILVKAVTGEDNHILTPQSRKCKGISWQQVTMQLRNEVGLDRSSVGSTMERWYYLVRASGPQIKDINSRPWKREEIEELRSLLEKHTDENKQVDYQAIMDKMGRSRQNIYNGIYVLSNKKFGINFSAEEDKIILKRLSTTTVTYGVWKMLSEELGRRPETIKRRYRDLIHKIHGKVYLSWTEEMRDMLLSEINSTTLVGGHRQWNLIADKCRSRFSTELGIDMSNVILDDLVVKKQYHLERNREMMRNPPNFTEEETKLLLQLVSDKEYHKGVHNLTIAWKRVGEVLGRSPIDCRANFIVMKRLQKKNTKPQKKFQSNSV